MQPCFPVFDRQAACVGGSDLFTLRAENTSAGAHVRPPSALTDGAEAPRGQVHLRGFSLGAAEISRLNLENFRLIPNLFLLRV